jgi:amino acid transporter
MTKPLGKGPVASPCPRQSRDRCDEIKLPDNRDLPASNRVCESRHRDGQWFTCDLAIGQSREYIASVSRLTWAWARDGALPQWFSHVCITCARQSQFKHASIITITTGSQTARIGTLCLRSICRCQQIPLSVNLASIASVSRLTWAWARDGALPQWFSHVCITCARVPYKRTQEVFALWRR